jgi:hypothetical protein
MIKRGLFILGLASVWATWASDDDPMSNLEAVYRCRTKSIDPTFGSRVKTLEVWMERGSDGLFAPDSPVYVALLNRRFEMVQFLSTTSVAGSWDPAHIEIQAFDDQDTSEQIGLIEVDECSHKGNLYSYSDQIPELSLTRCEHIVIPQN